MIYFKFDFPGHSQLSQSLRCFSQFSKVFMLFCFQFNICCKNFFLLFFLSRNGGCCLFEVCQLILYLVLTKVQKAQYTTHSQDSHIYGVLACEVKKSFLNFSALLKKAKLILYLVVTKGQKLQYTLSSLTHIRSWVLIK